MNLASSRFFPQWAQLIFSLVVSLAESREGASVFRVGRSPRFLFTLYKHEAPSFRAGGMRLLWLFFCF